MDRLHDLIQRYCPNGVVFARIADIADISIGEFVHKSKQSPDGKYPVYNGGTTNTGFYDDFNRTANKIIISARGANAGYVNRVFTNFWSGNSCYSIDVENTNADWNFVFYCLKNGEKKLLGEQQKGGIPAVSKKQVEQFRIPLPPLAVQQEIVRILDSFTELTTELNEKLTAELTARRKQYEHYRDELLTFGDDVPRISLGEVGPVCMCKRILKSQTNDIGGVPFYKIGTFGKEANAYISEDTYKEYRNKYNFPQKGDILISAAGTIGRTVVYDGKPAYFQDSNIVWIANDESKILNRFLIYCYAMKPWYISTGGTIARLYNDNILKARIPAPSLTQQAFIVDTLDRFDRICNNLTSGLPAEIAARQKQYKYFRNKLLTFKELEE